MSPKNDTEKNHKKDVEINSAQEKSQEKRTDTSDLGTMSLMSHLIELRSRLLMCTFVFIALFAVLFPFSQSLFSILVTPLSDLLSSSGLNRRMIYTGLPEAFITNIKVTLFFAFSCTIPVLSFHLARFISPGLYTTEKKPFLILVVMAPLLFALGAAFAFFLVIPKAWAFFLSFETAGTPAHLPIQLEARVSEYLSMTLQLMLAFGVCFQLPLVLFLLEKFNVISLSSLISKRRYAFIFILILSAILTPPDVFSMIALATPIYCLYELTILVVRFTNAKK